MNVNVFSYEWVCTEINFDTEAKCNAEMAYCSPQVVLSLTCLSTLDAKNPSSVNRQTCMQSERFHKVCDVLSSDWFQQL